MFCRINRMHKAGLIVKWLNKYLPKRDRCWKTSIISQEAMNHTVNLSDMQGSFFVLVLGSVPIFFTTYIPLTFFPEGVAEAFQIFLRDAHVLPKLFSYE
jgi:hypothetical protein